MAAIRFEGIDTDPTGGSAPVPDGYTDLQWENVYAWDTTSVGGTGYAVGTRSGTSVGFNGGGENASFSAAEGTFSLKSGYFTAAFHDEQVKLVALLDGQVVGKKKFSVDETHQEFVRFGNKFAHIDEVRIDTGGESMSQLAMDDLVVKFDDAAPPPAHDFVRAVPDVSYAPMLMNDGLVGAVWADWMLA